MMLMLFACGIWLVRGFSMKRFGIYFGKKCVIEYLNFMDIYTLNLFGVFVFVRFGIHCRLLGINFKLGAKA